MIKYIIYFLLLSSSAVLAAPYQYPEIVNVDVSCPAKKVVLEKIYKMYSVNEECPKSELKIKAVDLNSDGKCEFFLTTDWGRRCTPVTRLIFDVNDSKAIGMFEGKAISTFASKRNGYYRLINYTWTGYRTSMISTTRVYYFNGKEYVCELCRAQSHGGYIDLAKKAYDKKKYDLAEIYYWNAYAMNGEKKLSDANNLSIAYIKNGNALKAIRLLNKFLSYSVKKLRTVENYPCNYGNCFQADNKVKRLRASAYFNKGLAYESIGNTANAISAYENSLKEYNNNSIKKRIERLNSKNN